MKYVQRQVNLEVMYVALGYQEECSYKGSLRVSLIDHVETWHICSVVYCYFPFWRNFSVKGRKLLLKFRQFSDCCSLHRHRE